MSCIGKINTLLTRFTEGDLETPIQVKWNQAITDETSEIAIDRPAPNASVTISGTLLDASLGIFEYPWSAGDLVAGEGQLVKARLIDADGRRMSTEYFKIDVDEDIS